MEEALTIPAHYWLIWTFEPTVWFGIAATAALYGWLVHASNRRALREGGRPGSLGRPVCFFLGLAILFLALESPLDEIGELFLFWVHMVQHMLLGFVVAPLLLLGLRGRFPAVPPWVRGPFREMRAATRGHSLLSRVPGTAGALAAWTAWRTFSLLVHPVVAILVFNGVFSAYHIPALYQAGLADPVIHAFEHLVLLFTAIVTWWPVLSPLPELPALAPPARMVYVFLDGLGMTPVFAGITFSSGVVYEWYAHAPRIMNLTPLEDQQMGGIVMKLMGGAAYLAALLHSFYLWTKSDADATGPRFLGDEADASLVLEERAHSMRRAQRFR